MLKKLLFIVSILGSSLCSLQIQAEQSPASWTLDPLVFTLDQNIANDYYLPEAGFKEVLQSNLQRRLATSNKLVDTPTADTLKIEVRVNYLRRFPGDLTPFPSSTVTSPNIFFGIRLLRNDEVWKSFHSKEMVANDATFFGRASIESLARDAGHLLAVSNTIIKTFNELVPDANIPPEPGEEEVKTTVDHYMTLKQQVPHYEFQRYIPEEVTEQYLAGISSSDRKVRLTTYSKLTRDWMNEPRVYNKIHEQLLQSYATATSKDDIKEVREAMNALASSGMDVYLPFFKEIKSSTADPAIVKQVDDSLKILTRRTRQNAVVHNTKTMHADFDWKTNQNINILKLPETGVRVALLKQIYRDKQWDVNLLQAIADELENSAFANAYRSGVNHDVHAWMCIVLGAAGNKTHQDLLQRMSEEATSDKVRKHAKDNFKKLRKIKS